jgi:hypothetical protein
VNLTRFSLLAVGSLLFLGQAAPCSSADDQKTGPIITDFYAVCNYGNVWTFSGHVLDNGSSCPINVNFGNLNSLMGKSTEVRDDGSFLLIVTLAPGESGLASAQAVEDSPQALASTVEYVGVFP